MQLSLIDLKAQTTETSELKVSLISVRVWLGKVWIYTLIR